MSAHITVVVENSTSTGGLFITPLWVGFQDGSFDIYDSGSPASVALEKLAEDGNTSGLASALNTADANSNDGVLFGTNGVAGVIDPEEIASATFTIDDATSSRYFSYASMIVPSNDAFIANGNPFAYELFDANGNFFGKQEIIINGNDILDAGTEDNTETDAAFLNQSAPNTGATTDGGVVATHEGFIGSEGNPGDGGNIFGGTTAAGTITTKEAGDFTQSNFELAKITILQSFDLSGNGGNDLIAGADGYDTLAGSSGDDSLHGYEGNDILEGGNGNDYLDGGKGHDILEGGNHNDYIIGGDGYDMISGGNHDDSLYGGQGNDMISGGNHADYIDGGDDNDSLNGGNGDDSLYGGAGDDTLSGGNNDDYLFGGSGDDELWASEGNESFYGGAGEDKFIFDDDATGFKAIFDFDNSEGDIIVFAGIAEEFSDLTISDNSAGNAVVWLEDQSITLDGHASTDVNADWFDFI